MFFSAYAFFIVKKYKWLYNAAGPSYNNVINSQYGEGQLNLKYIYKTLIQENAFVTVVYRC